jgi:repressor LexA
MTALGLTPRQKDAFAFLREHRMRKGVYPSFEEIRVGLNLRSRSSVSRLLEGLETRGHIRRGKNLARAIEIIEHRPRTKTISVDLPDAVQAQLAAFCAARGDEPEHVMFDALVIHLDQMEASGTKEAVGS